MNAMPILVALSLALAPTHFSVAQQDADKTGPLKLSRAYKVGDVDKYSISINGDNGMSIEAKITEKTTRVLDGGKATMEVTISDITTSGNAQTAPPPFTEDFDSNGLPAHMSVKDEKVPVTAASICSFLPSQVESGKEFVVDWTSADKELTLKGKGTYEGTKDIGGKKAVVLKTTVDVTPQGDTPGTVHNTANIDKDTGKLISAEATVDLDQGSVTVKVKAL